MLPLLWWHSWVVPCAVPCALGRFNDFFKHRGDNDELLGFCENVAQFDGLLYTVQV
jgi:hypothetical protein